MAGLTKITGSQGTLTDFTSTGIDDNADATSITIDSSEKVGIGTTSPARDLHIHGADSDTHQLHITNTTTGATSNDGVSFALGSDETLIINQREDNHLRILTNDSERLRVDNNGNVLIRTTSQIGSSNSRLQISNTGKTFGMAIEDDSGNTGFIQFHNNGGTAVGSIVRSGSGTNYQSSSDYRLKENIVDITDATNRVKQLQPKRFNFIADADTTVDGFIAHEVSSIVPEAIHGTKDAVDENGNPIYQGIDQSKLVPVLTKALQEAITKIEQLETRIQTLENN